MVHVLLCVEHKHTSAVVIGIRFPFFPACLLSPFNPSLHLPQRSILVPCRCMVWWVISLPFHVAEGEESSFIRWCHLVIYHVCTERQSDVYS